MNYLSEGQEPGGDPLPVQWINVQGREEHEAVIKDATRCKELGVDQMFETMTYLHRWGGWLGE